MRNLYRKLRTLLFKSFLDKRILSLSNKILDISVNYYLEVFKCQPKTFVEIGANFFQDSEYMRRFHGVNRVHAIEANEEIYLEGKKLFKNIRAYQIGISNFKGHREFFKSNIDSENNGVSSFYKRTTEKKWISDSSIVEVLTFDEWHNKNLIGQVDILKIDVEGHTYEVLEGAVKTLDKVSVIQAECEIELSAWENQEYFYDSINEFLHEKGFILVYFERLPGGKQCDCIWLNGRKFN